MSSSPNKRMSRAERKALGLGSVADSRKHELTDNPKNLIKYNTALPSIHDEDEDEHNEGYNLTSPNKKGKRSSMGLMNI